MRGLSSRNGARRRGSFTANNYRRPNTKSYLSNETPVTDAKGKVQTTLTLDSDADCATSKSTQFLQSKPKDPLPYIWRGLAYFAKGDDARAAERFTDALKRYPVNVTASFCHSMVYRHAADS